MKDNTNLISFLWELNENSWDKIKEDAYQYYWSSRNTQILDSSYPCLLSVGKAKIVLYFYFELFIYFIMLY